MFHSLPLQPLRRLFPPISSALIPFLQSDLKSVEGVASYGGDKLQKLRSLSPTPTHHCESARESWSMLLVLRSQYPISSAASRFPLTVLSPEVGAASNGRNKLRRRSKVPLNPSAGRMSHDPFLAVTASKRVLPPYFGYADSISEIGRAHV